MLSQSQSAQNDDKVEEKEYKGLVFVDFDGPINANLEGGLRGASSKEGEIQIRNPALLVTVLEY